MSEMLERVELPSRGFYNPKYKEPLMIDMMDFECEKLVFGSHTDEALDEVMKRVVKSPENFDPLELTEEDRMFLLWKIRIHTYGDQYHGYYVDDNGEAKKVKVSLDDMPYDVITDKYENPKGRLPHSKHMVEIRELTLGQIRKIEEYCKEKSDKMNISYSVLRYEAVRARRIYKVDGNEQNTNEALDFLHSLKGLDLSYIDWLYNKLGDYGYKNYIETTIDGKKRRVSVTINGEFFRPDFDDWSSEG